MPSPNTLKCTIGCFHVVAAVLIGLSYPKAWIFIWGGATLFGFLADEALSKANEQESIIDDLKKQIKYKDELLSSLQAEKHPIGDSIKQSTKIESTFQDRLQVTTFRLKRMNNKK